MIGYVALALISFGIISIAASTNAWTPVWTNHLFHRHTTKPTPPSTATISVSRSCIIVFCNKYCEDVSRKGRSITPLYMKVSSGEKILWQGPLFGRLTKPAKAHLLRNGWKERPVDHNHKYHQMTTTASNTSNRLALIWPNKSGPQLEMDDPFGAHIRPYPKHVTDVLDDKVRMADLLLVTDTQAKNYLPRHISSLQDAHRDKLYFVKHRHGAQGKSVSVYNHTELTEWWARTNNTHDFVVQEEVMPHLFRGRKFVMRSHILVWHHQSAKNMDNGSDRCLDPATFHFHVFSNVIVQHHTSEYEADSRRRDCQIIQAGKNHPAPQLLQELPSDHPAANSFQEIEQASQLVVSAFERSLDDTFNKSLVIAPQTKCFALLGLDWLLQSPNTQHENKSRLKLCEINTHPALGWGTMAKAPSPVFADLLEQTLDLLLSSAGEIEEK
ncbi:tubulin-tyrosine ligase family protein [Nitzschia inconspicua]|uniref:Tubulin-tyrosine ligase family protein n=1 Tax=Nitzschia inconspicua TaxID=303405 RepID=A0A9K3LTV4_9STRA|nr:tubulin-tyrosine ligase family protein [Nitzschia inconspicua]